MSNTIATTQQHEATVEVLHECASILKGVNHSGKANDTKIGYFYSLAYTYFVSVRKERPSVPLRQEHSFYNKALELSDSGDVKDKIETLKDYIRKYVAYARNCSVATLRQYEKSAQAQLMKYPIEKAQELIYMLDYYIQHEEQIVRWAKDEELESNGYTTDVLVATLTRLQAIDQKLKAIENNTFEFDVVEQCDIIPTIKEEVFLMSTATKVNFVSKKKLGELVFQQLGEYVNLTAEEVEIFEDFYPANICLADPGVFVLNLEADFPADNALIFVVTATNGIDVFSTDYGLAEVNKSYSRQALVQWLVENVDSFGELATSEGKEGTTYEQLSVFLNALPY